MSFVETLEVGRGGENKCEFQVVILDFVSYLR